jgi:protein-S-isoprenylcysteine O-methyltransferase Ste14
MHTYHSLVFDFPEAILFWIVFLWVFVPEARLIRTSSRSSSQAQDAGTLRLIVVGNNVAIFLGFVSSFVPLFAVPWSQLFFIFGTCLLFAGGILRRLCFRTLGKYFTGNVVVTSDQIVIERGPYRFVRHPSYTAGFMIFIGTGFALGNWLSIVFLFAGPCFVYFWRVRAEEKALLEMIGEPYRAYMARTKRFIPFLL